MRRTSTNLHSNLEEEQREEPVVGIREPDRPLIVGFFSGLVGKIEAG